MMVKGMLPRFQWSADQEPLHVVPAFTVTFKSGHGGLLWLELPAEPPPRLRRDLFVAPVDQPDRFGPAGVAGDQGGFLIKREARQGLQGGQHRGFAVGLSRDTNALRGLLHALS